MTLPKIQTLKEGEWLTLETDTIHYNWCCDCGLRHIAEYRIVKNKKDQLVVQLRSWRDDYSTELQRSYDRLKKRSKK
jgi:hypothetical protein